MFSELFHYLAEPKRRDWRAVCFKINCVTVFQFDFDFGDHIFMTSDAPTGSDFLKSDSNSQIFSSISLLGLLDTK
jgi:hypothetical protein